MAVADTAVAAQPQNAADGEKTRTLVQKFLMYGGSCFAILCVVYWILFFVSGNSFGGEEPVKVVYETSDYGKDRDIEKVEAMNYVNQMRNYFFDFDFNRNGMIDADELSVALDYA